MRRQDDFTERTKHYVAHRAGYHCSFRGCPQPTAGPGNESPIATINIGEAAHICAAAPGGKRYDESMTPAERRHISNAIWLCSTHAKLIDRDEALYTIDYLRRMKAEHEEIRAKKVQLPSGETGTYGLIAVGPNIVCTGEIVEVDGQSWSLELERFVRGDFNSLIAFGEGFGQLASAEQHVLVNAIGDGRTLTKAPAVSKLDVGYSLRCEVAPSFPRIAAQELGSQFAISPVTNDPFVENGQLARVSGLASLSQKVRSCLSLQRGESHFDPTFGVRFAEYFDAFRGSPWLAHFFMLDVVRQSSIPYYQGAMNQTYTPLQCVERVLSVEVLAEGPENGRLPLRVVFEVKGVGRWHSDISVFLPLLAPAEV